MLKENYSSTQASQKGEEANKAEIILAQRLDLVEPGLLHPSLSCLICSGTWDQAQAATPSSVELPVPQGAAAPLPLTTYFPTPTTMVPGVLQCTLLCSECSITTAGLYGTRQS